MTSSTGNASLTKDNAYKAPQFKTPVILDPIRFTPNEVDELLAQRRICGWNYELSDVKSWQASVERGEETLFWISLPVEALSSSSHPSSNASTTSTTASSSTISIAAASSSSEEPVQPNVNSSKSLPTIRAGHVSLSRLSKPPHPLLANSDGKTYTIKSFFINPRYRSLGLGRATMTRIESLATQQPYGNEGCEAIVLDTMSAKYYDATRPEWTYLKDREVGKWSNQLWYQRLGYRVVGEAPRYTEEVPAHLGGGTVTYDAVFLRKDLHPPSASADQTPPAKSVLAPTSPAPVLTPQPQHQPERPRVGVGVFVLHPQTYRFLLGHRLGSLGAHTWGLPGGHLEFAESFEECAEREVYEETGLRVRGTRFLTATGGMVGREASTGDGDGGGGRHYVTIFMVADLVVAVGEGDGVGEETQVEVREPEKCAGWRWVGWGEMCAWAEAEAEAEPTRRGSGGGTGDGDRNGGGGGDGDHPETETGAEETRMKLFSPLLTLLAQRPGVIPR